MNAVLLVLALASGQDARRPEDGGRLARKLKVKSKDDLKSKIKAEAREKREGAAEADKASLQTAAVRLYAEINRDLYSVCEAVRKVGALEDAGKAAEQARRNDSALKKIAEDQKKKVQSHKTKAPTQATLESQIYDLVTELHEEFRANSVIADLLWDADKDGFDGTAATLIDKNLTLGEQIIELTLVYIGLTGDRMDDELFESWIATLDRYLEYCFVEDLED